MAYIQNKYITTEKALVEKYLKTLLPKIQFLKMNNFCSSLNSELSLDIE